MYIYIIILSFFFFSCNIDNKEIIICEINQINKNEIELKIINQTNENIYIPINNKITNCEFNKYSENPLDLTFLLTSDKKIQETNVILDVFNYKLPFIKNDIILKNKLDPYTTLQFYKYLNNGFYIKKEETKVKNYILNPNYLRLSDDDFSYNEIPKGKYNLQVYINTKKSFYIDSLNHKIDSIVNLKGYKILKNKLLISNKINITLE